jgi:hypothetical protein
MNWFINDLSFNGQYTTQNDFITFLRELLKSRHSNQNIKSNLYCSRMLPQLNVVLNQSVREVVDASKDKHLKNQLLEWLNKKGPFWDDHREAIENDDFELFDTVVTNQGAGEAARQFLLGRSVSLFSLENSKPCCSITPLTVMHIQEDLEQRPQELNNHWTIPQLIKHSESLRREPINWEQLLEVVEEKFKFLLIHESIAMSLAAQPFSPSISRRVVELLSVLNDLVSSRDKNREYTKKTYEIFNTFFAGDGALFTDESVTNKRDFKSKLTFTDPLNKEIDIFCPWHGKISHRYFRIHFEFPLPSKKEKMAISYIGYKLAK